MKLATVNPRLDFNIDDLFEKEVIKNVQMQEFNFSPNLNLKSVILMC